MTKANSPTARPIFLVMFMVAAVFVSSSPASALGEGCDTSNPPWPSAAQVCIEHWDADGNGNFTYEEYECHIEICDYIGSGIYYCTAECGLGEPLGEEVDPSA